MFFQPKGSRKNFVLTLQVIHFHLHVHILSFSKELAILSGKWRDRVQGFFQKILTISSENKQPVAEQGLQGGNVWKGTSIYYVNKFLDFFWPTHPLYITLNKYWTSAKIDKILTPPTLSLFWRNIGMVPKANRCYYIYASKQIGLNTCVLCL